MDKANPKANDNISKDMENKEIKRPHPKHSGPGPRIKKSQMAYFKKKVCRFCTGQYADVTYKDYGILKKFISERGKILPRRMTGTCAKHQNRLANAIKRARTVALLPFVSK